MTLVVHVEGATWPRFLNEPEYVKADVYFPGHMVCEVPYTSVFVSNIVQQLFVILAFRPSSTLIDVPGYSGICPWPILARFQHHILHRLPHPLPPLQVPVSSSITAPRPYYQQWLFVSSWMMSSHTCNASHHSSHSQKDFVFSVIKGTNPK